MNERQADKTTAPGDTPQVAAEFWEKIEAGIGSEEDRELVSRLVKRQRETGEPSNEQILSILRAREVADRERSELREIRSLQDGTHGGTRRCWRRLRDWRENHGGAVEMEWAEEFADVTQDLLSQVEDLGRGSLGAKPIHRLGMALEAVLDGELHEVTYAYARIQEVEVLLREVARLEASDVDKGAPVPEKFRRTFSEIATATDNKVSRIRALARDKQRGGEVLKLVDSEGLGHVARYDIRQAKRLLDEIDRKKAQGTGD